MQILSGLQMVFVYRRFYIYTCFSKINLDAMNLHYSSKIHLPPDTTIQLFGYGITVVGHLVFNTINCKFRFIALFCFRPLISCLSLCNIFWKINNSQLISTMVVLMLWQICPKIPRDCHHYLTDFSQTRIIAVNLVSVELPNLAMMLAKSRQHRSNELTPAHSGTVEEPSENLTSGALKINASICCYSSYMYQFSGSLYAQYPANV